MTAVEQAAAVLAAHDALGYDDVDGCTCGADVRTHEQHRAHVAAALAAAGLLAGPDAAVRALREAADEIERQHMQGWRLGDGPVVPAGTSGCITWLRKRAAALEADAGVQAPTSEGVCDSGCQPDWHKDWCAIYDAPTTATEADEDGAT